MKSGVTQVIKFKNYSVNYPVNSLVGEGSKCVLSHINFNLEFGSSYALVGPSGCGKTTFIYGLTGLLPKSAIVQGLIEGVCERTMATVLQEYGLFPWKTVFENVALPLELKKEPVSSQELKVHCLLNQLGISEKMNQYPGALSGGQKQRVAIARALVTNTDIIVMDEPFSALDAITRELIQDDFKKLIRSLNKTLFLVTHNIEEAVVLAENILIMNANGEIIDHIKNDSFRLEKQRERDGYYKTCTQVRKSLNSEINKGEIKKDNSYEKTALSI